MNASERNMAATAPGTNASRAEESFLSVDPYLGSRLGPYVLLERIGEGGMGAVYRARQPGSEEDVAIKVIKRGMDTDLVLRRFENERRILTAVLHPNVSRLLGGALVPAKNDPVALGQSDPRQERDWEQAEGRAISSTLQACGLLFIIRAEGAH